MHYHFHSRDAHDGRSDIAFVEPRWSSPSGPCPRLIARPVGPHRENPHHVSDPSQVQTLLHQIRPQPAPCQCLRSADLHRESLTGSRRLKEAQGGSLALLDLGRGCPLAKRQACDTSDVPWTGVLRRGSAPPGLSLPEETSPSLMSVHACFTAQSAMD